MKLQQSLFFRPGSTSHCARTFLQARVAKFIKLQNSSRALIAQKCNSCMLATGSYRLFLPLHALRFRSISIHALRYLQFSVGSVWGVCVRVSRNSILTLAYYSARNEFYAYLAAFLQFIDVRKRKGLLEKYWCNYFGMPKSGYLIGRQGDIQDNWL